VPFLQNGAELLHLLLQAPQLLGSLLMFTSQPSEVMPLQLAKPELQVPTWHVPPEQLTVAFGNGEQWLPQTPQLFTSVLRFVSQPVDGLLSQLAKPELQVPSWQTPALQTAIPF
jgi:hypothetical protein